MNYVKFTTVMAGSIALKGYLEEQKMLPASIWRCKSLLYCAMASIERIDVYEAVTRSAREKGKSYDEALKEFLERFERSFLTFDWIAAKVDIKDAEFFKQCKVIAADAYQNAKEKYKIDPKGLLDWIANNFVIFEENRNKLEL